MEENERKAIFTNTVFTSREMHLELYHSVRAIWYVIVSAVSVGFLVWMGLQLRDLILAYEIAGESVLSEPVFWMTILGLAIWLFIPVWAVLIAPKRYANRQLRMYAESYGTEQAELVNSFFDDAVVLHNQASNGEMRFAYSSVKKVTETKNLFLIWTEQKQIVVLSRRGFDGTDAAGFRRFMDEKCPNAKRKWRKEKTA